MSCARPVGATLSYDVAAFAWRLKNFVRPLGLLALGLPCQLTGSGMAFPWRTISAANLASGNIVEDMALGVELALRAEPPLYCPDAEVVSTFPISSKALQTQRRRWEQGHFQTILGSAGPLILSGVSNRSLDQVALGLDLAVPPLTALAFMTCVVLALCLALQGFGLSAAPFYVAAADAVLLLSAVITAWADHGQELLPVGALPRTRAVFDEPGTHIPVDIENEGGGAVDPDGPQVKQTIRTTAQRPTFRVYQVVETSLVVTRLYFPRGQLYQLFGPS